MMNDTGESAAIRLWRDRAQLREQERNDAQVQARITEEKVTSLTAENVRLADENARLRAQLTPDPASTHTEIEREMENVRSELLSLLAPTNERERNGTNGAPPVPLHNGGTASSGGSGRPDRSRFWPVCYLNRYLKLA